MSLIAVLAVTVIQTPAPVMAAILLAMHALDLVPRLVLLAARPSFSTRASVSGIALQVFSVTLQPDNVQCAPLVILAHLPLRDAREPWIPSALHGRPANQAIFNQRWELPALIVCVHNVWHHAPQGCNCPTRAVVSSTTPALHALPRHTKIRLVHKYVFLVPQLAAPRNILVALARPPPHLFVCPALHPQVVLAVSI